MSEPYSDYNFVTQTVRGHQAPTEGNFVYTTNNCLRQQNSYSYTTGLSSMANKAKSDTKKGQLACEAIQEFTRRAITAYQAELKKPNGKGARTVAKDFMNLYQLETGKKSNLAIQR